MTKEEAVERIMNFNIMDSSMFDTDKVRADLTAILTELMKPITDEDIEDQANKAANRFSVLGDMQCVFESGYMAGAKWAVKKLVGK